MLMRVNNVRLAIAGWQDLVKYYCSAQLPLGHANSFLFWMISLFMNQTRFFPKLFYYQRARRRKREISGGEGSFTEGEKGEKVNQNRGGFDSPESKGWLS